MKRIIFPCTSRVHEARQKILLEELSEDNEVSVWSPTVSPDVGLAKFTVLCFIEFNNFLSKKEFDIALIRADRLELLPLAALCAYKQIPIVHIEGGSESGQAIIDSKIRHAITQLADIHLVTDEQARRKVIYLGADPDKVHNVGSLDVSFAKSVKPKPIYEDYILLLHHAIPREDTKIIHEAIKGLGHQIIGIKSNQDYNESLMHEEYSPEDFINLMRYARCFISNSSAACKESSILGVPTILVGHRQDGRVIGHNVIRAPHDKEEIKKVTEYQIKHGQYKPDYIYYQKNTERKICGIIKKL